jgi:hypothetical protein
MPWTFAHIAAAVPFRRWSPRYFSIFGLAVGCVTPDLGYYLGLHALADFAHSLPGLAVSLPTGLLLAALAWSLCDLLLEPLPQPHRGALRQACAGVAADFTRRRLLVLGASIALGALTHMAWDSFTHATGPPVEASDLLRRALFQAGGTGVPTYSVLQHLSTLFGIAVLAIVYRNWLRGLAPSAAMAPDGADALRWWILGALAMLAAAVLTAHVMNGLRAGHGDVDRVVVNGVLFASNVLAVAYLATALVLRRYLGSGRGNSGGAAA